MAGTTTELLFKDEVRNVIGCLEFLMKEAKESLTEDAGLTETEVVLEDCEKALDFLYELAEEKRESTTEKGCAYCPEMHANKCPDAFSAKACYCGLYDHTAAYDMRVMSAQALLNEIRGLDEDDMWDVVAVKHKDGTYSDVDMIVAANDKTVSLFRKRKGEVGTPVTKIEDKLNTLNSYYLGNPVVYCDDEPGNCTNETQTNYISKVERDGEKLILVLK